MPVHRVVKSFSQFTKDEIYLAVALSMVHGLIDASGMDEDGIFNSVEQSNSEQSLLFSSLIEDTFDFIFSSNPQEVADFIDIFQCKFPIAKVSE